MRAVKKRKNKKRENIQIETRKTEERGKKKKKEERRKKAEMGIPLVAPLKFGVSSGDFFWGLPGYPMEDSRFRGSPMGNLRKFHMRFISRAGKSMVLVFVFHGIMAPRSILCGI